MKTEATQAGTTLALVLLLVVVLFPVGYLLGGAALGPDRAGPFLEPPGPEHTECVRPVEYMRYHHMDFLKEIRDEVLREGIRQDIGIESCRDCHPDRATFCNRCHESVNLTPDCFGCHYYE